MQSEGKRRGKQTTTDSTASTKPPPIVLPTGLDPLSAVDDGMDELEAAGMLLTDFHHKAMASQEPEPIPNGDSHHQPPAMLEPNISYPAGPVSSLPQMAWDPFMPSAKSHSISSAGSQEPPHLHYNGSMLINSHPPPLPPSWSGNMSGSDSIDSLSFHALNSSLPGLQHGHPRSSLRPTPPCLALCRPSTTAGRPAPRRP